MLTLTVIKEMKCRGDSEIREQQEKVRGTTRKSEKHELIRVVSRTISCCISESPLQFISFLTVIPMCLGVLWRGVFVQLVAVAGPGLLSLLREVLRKLLWQYKDDICRGL